jgi:hypothetical protein
VDELGSRSGADVERRGAEVNLTIVVFPFVGCLVVCGEADEIGKT